jgi:hypothetical protein
MNTENIRLIETSIDIEFTSCSNENDELRYKEEYNKMIESDNDPVGHWIKQAKAKGETNTDEILLTLIVELHRKIDDLNRVVKNEKLIRTNLQNLEDINGIGYEHFRFKNSILNIDEKYYGRINLPVFPQRQIPIFFKALEPNLAEVVLIHEQDSKDWDMYVASREREVIRQMRNKKNG